MSIVNRPHNFIFLKSYKTAGTSIEIHLICQSELGSDIYRTSKDIRKYSKPVMHRNFGYTLAGRRRFFTLHWRLAGQFPGIKQHQTAEEVKKVVGDEIWQNSLISVPVRNPWDMLVSRYEWDSAGRNGRSEKFSSDFGQWLSRAMQPIDLFGGLSYAQKQIYPFLFCDEEFIAGHLCYFEDIDGSLIKLGEQLGIEIPPLSQTPVREKKTSRKKDYRPYYSSDQAEAVAEHFERFLSVIPYRFENNSV